MWALTYFFTQKDSCNSVEEKLKKKGCSNLFYFSFEQARCFEEIVCDLKSVLEANGFTYMGLIKTKDCGIIYWWKNAGSCVYTDVDPENEELGCE